MIFGRLFSFRNIFSRNQKNQTNAGKSEILEFIFLCLFGNKVFSKGENFFETVMNFGKTTSLYKRGKHSLTILYNFFMIVKRQRICSWESFSGQFIFLKSIFMEIIFCKNNHIHSNIYIYILISYIQSQTCTCAFTYVLAT